MKHVIIGTAGHVDHGKTLLVKALTGIDTDRLQEEKKRGITIELGFAHIDFEDGTRAGIVDVPGHEKFIKNMLAGAGGIDLAMLIVAADEGFMPQTVEHLGILSLLGIKDGLVVITKTDMVEPDWVEMVTEDVKEQVQGTFLEDKPILPVSAYTGEGIEELRKLLHQLVLEAGEKDMRMPFRLPVDRVFSAEGFGTVVTGTLIEGCIHEEDLAELAPSGQETRIRNLQVHGQPVDVAYAGQRVALNLAKLKKSEVSRGDVVCKPGSLGHSMMLDVRLQNLPNSTRVILDGSQVHLYHGARVVLAKVVLLEGEEELLPGSDCYAQLRLLEPLSAKKGDRFVIRFYSPLETIGGGVILDEAPRKHKRNDPAALEALRIKESGSGDQRIIQTLTELGCELPDRKALAEKLAMDPEELGGQLQDLVGRGKAIEALPGRYLSAVTLDGVWETCQGLLQSYHKANPLHAGMKVAELRQKLFRRVDQAAADGILQALVDEGKLRRAADRYALQEFEVQLTKRQSAIREKLLKVYQEAEMDPPSVDEVGEMFPVKEREEFRQVMESLLSGGELVMFTPQIVYHNETYRKVTQAAADWFAAHETLTLAEFRDLLGTSRKYSQAILEYYDRCKMTKKEGDLRKIGQVPFQ